MPMDEVSELFSKGKNMEEIANKLKEEEPGDINSKAVQKSYSSGKGSSSRETASDLKEKMDEAFDNSEDDFEDIFSNFERAKGKLQARMMEEAQKTFLKQMTGKIEEVIEQSHDELENEFTKAIMKLEEQENALKELKADMNEHSEMVSEMDEKIENLEEERKEQFEDVHDRIQSLRENVNQNEQELASRVKENKSKIDEIEGNMGDKDFSKLEERIDDLQEKLEEDENAMVQIKDRFEEEDLVMDGTNVPKMEQKVKENRKMMNKLQEKIDELEQIEIDDNLKSQIVSQLRGEVEDTVYTPDEIDSKMKGQEVTVKGRLQFKKKVSGRNFYKMTGSGGDIIIASKKKMPEGKKELTGEIENVKGNLCLVTD